MSRDSYLTLVGFAIILGGRLLGCHNGRWCLAGLGVLPLIFSYRNIGWFAPSLDEGFSNPILWFLIGVTMMAVAFFWGAIGRQFARFDDVNGG